MKRKQKRYNHERAIHAEIFHHQRVAGELLKEAEAKEAEGHRIIRHSQGNPDLKEAGIALLEEAGRIRNGRMKYRETKLEQLKQALSAFQTELLPGMGADRSVVVR